MGWGTQEEQTPIMGILAVSSILPILQDLPAMVSRKGQGIKIFICRR